MEWIAEGKEACVAADYAALPHDAHCVALENCVVRANGLTDNILNSKAEEGIAYDLPHAQEFCKVEGKYHGPQIDGLGIFIFTRNVGQEKHLYVARGTSFPSNVIDYLSYSKYLAMKSKLNPPMEGDFKNFISSIFVAFSTHMRDWVNAKIQADLEQVGRVPPGQNNNNNNNNELADENDGDEGLDLNFLAGLEAANAPTALEVALEARKFDREVMAPAFFRWWYYIVANMSVGETVATFQELCAKVFTKGFATALQSFFNATGYDFVATPDANNLNDHADLKAKIQSPECLDDMIFKLNHYKDAVDENDNDIEVTTGKLLANYLLILFKEMTSNNPVNNIDKASAMIYVPRGMETLRDETLREHRNAKQHDNKARHISIYKRLDDKVKQILNANKDANGRSTAVNTGNGAMRYTFNGHNITVQGGLRSRTKIYTPEIFTIGYFCDPEVMVATGRAVFKVMRDLAQDFDGYFAEKNYLTGANLPEKECSYDRNLTFAFGNADRIKIKPLKRGDRFERALGLHFGDD